MVRGQYGPGLATVAGDTLDVNEPRTVLAAHHVGERFFGTDGLNGVKHFSLFVADFVGIEGDGRLHRGHGEKLEEMVRDHVAERAGCFVETAAMLDADGFSGGDLHVIDAIAVPERRRAVFGKTKDQYSLTRPF